ncbi:hypothetical protein A1D29_06185 [Pasteurellaceae bacterium Orientalotternb1]|nr:hypothetical protein A1D29_06185 [Pasteurellaceae bacterium Orientalotternb1]
MSQPSYSLPPRKWYTLEQAAKRIAKLTGEEIEVGDLLHFWYINQLEISIFFRKTETTLTIGEYKFDNEEFIFIEQPKYFITSDSKIEVIEGAIYENFEIDNIFNKILFDDGYITYTGICSIVPSAFNYVEMEKEIIEKGICVNFAGNLITPKHSELKTRLSFFIQFKNFEKARYSYLNKENLYILNDHLDDFISNRSNELQSIAKKEKQPTTKTLNSQAEFIRNLITIHYGEKAANNIRNELENSRSRISRDFDENALKAPSGKTVDRWINQI